MSIVKVLVYGIWSGLVVQFFTDLIFYSPEPLTLASEWSSFIGGFALGAYLSSYISWGWSLGGVAGLFAGSHLPIFPLMYFSTPGSYEDILGWLLLGGGIGLLLGGYGLDSLFKRSALRRKTSAHKHHN
ncbi:hypothetical protein [Pseudomonas sp. NFR16]|uniref:hypothetical protein n=1 Tax=Pseudomonas sp. NFR16 TaxID=1566248 RepID=UPI0011605D26|nr:hypothetical protein [Pseudomonas sp. NFR16]